MQSFDTTRFVCYTAYASTGYPVFELCDWDELPDWQPQTVVHKFQDGRYSKDFQAKLVERGIRLSEVLSTLRSRSSYIIKYRDRYTGRWRIGFWHPRLQLFVAWAAGPYSVFKTCFERKDGLRYMVKRLTESSPIYRPPR
jgi:hypothetical protein